MSKTILENEKETYKRIIQTRRKRITRNISEQRKNEGQGATLAHHCGGINTKIYANGSKKREYINNFFTDHTRVGKRITCHTVKRNDQRAK